VAPDRVEGLGLELARVRRLIRIQGWH
jgi:hypothetical protein